MCLFVVMSMCTYMSRCVCVCVCVCRIIIDYLSVCMRVHDRKNEMFSKNCNISQIFYVQLLFHTVLKFNCQRQNQLAST